MTFIDPRLTERRNPRTADIDLASPLEIVDLINAEDRTVPDAVASQREAIARADRTRRDDVPRTAAACSTSARAPPAGSACSTRPNVRRPSAPIPRWCRGSSPADRQALTRSQEGAEDRLEGGASRISTQHGVRAGDFVIGIAASGTTPYVRRALDVRAERRRDAPRSSPARRRRRTRSTSPTSSILPITGPEVVTGSTRMKAGTATKLVLNMITTGAMIRLGKTFGNLMVDLRATNVKLVDRSERIVMEVCERRSRDGARELLDARGGSVKTAIVMHSSASSRDEAERALAERRRRDPPRARPRRRRR